MNSKQLKGLPVLIIADGEQIGTVARGYLDVPARQVVGFAVHTKSGMFEVESEPKIDAERVHTLGTGGLLVDDASATHGATIQGRLGELVSLDDLNSLTMLTEDGVSLGRVASADFDEHSFHLTRLEASSGMLKSNRQAAMADVISIGLDYVVVASVVSADDYVADGRPVSAATTSRRIRWVEAETTTTPPAPVVDPVKAPATKLKARRKSDPKLVDA